ncbi:MAG: hypothetical protein HYU64_15850 [Armatimonadetes bacterium]|nr:hypothetical protein [Armatimonadota bacterium]
MRKILALDFDGVIWDSVRECLVVGAEAYRAAGGRLLSQEWAEKHFYAGRPLCRTGQDFYLLFRLPAENPNLDFARFPYPDFIRAREAYREEMASFEKLFYEIRRHWVLDRFEDWANLQAPYSGILREISEISQIYADIVVVTTKDEHSASRLLGRWNLHIPVYGKEFSTNKGEVLKYIQGKCGILPEQICLVDDLLENLLPHRDLGVRLALAGWGYNTVESREWAKEQGIPVLELGKLRKGLDFFLV